MFFKSSFDLSLSEFKLKLAEEGGTVMDCRTPLECSDGTWPDAVQADWNGGQFAGKAKTLDKNQPVYCYCRSGARSGAAVKYLKDQGFISVFNLGGYAALKG
tara:strand:- start:3866 stop:4171 length:306 start_codon:yes stop_codon:yes gene_type:complete